MTQKKDPAQKEATPPKTSRAKRKPAAADDGGSPSEEAPVVKRPRGRPAKDPSSPTMRTRSSKPAMPTPMATKVSAKTRKAAETPAPDADGNVPSTSKGLPRKAPRVSRKPRSRSSSPSTGDSVATKAPKRGHRSRSRSRGSSSHHAKRGRSRARSSHSFLSGRGGHKRKSGRRGPSTADAESSRGMKRGRSKGRRHRSKNHSSAASTTTTGTGGGKTAPPRPLIVEPWRQAGQVQEGAKQHFVEASACQAYECSQGQKKWQVKRSR
ncbi:serine/arginine repetitive matrix protein 2-like [Dermacentor silvarum]|uniref:serine/arginine repetitive matrix protein 2-like n=1 Tax=Dermacentor silvarum TaxID=543639 RepID=UPI0018984523|nr:serine/arginine repetitive matrix protein 2-like [Dermacentor silvarum]